MIPPNRAPYLTDWLYDIGPSIASAMGEGPVSYTDLAAWQEISGVVLMPWEAQVIRTLSREYIRAKHDAREASCPPPYSGAGVQQMRDRVSEQFKALASGLRKKPSGEGQ